MLDRDRLLADIYDELRQAAARMIRREAPQLTLRPTELVNEAAMRVMKLDRMTWQDRQHLFATCARVLRQTMIDELRKRRAQKRQTPEITVTFEDMNGGIEIERLAELLVDLEEISPPLSAIVDLRFFAGLTVPEIAASTGQSERTVKRRWQTAKAWLATQLADA
jgi:RNA polymerase sigma factor (TIGR02999 family)